MRILFVSYFCPPEVVAPRVFETAVRLAKRGHQVTILTGLPNHPRGVLFEGYRWRWMQREEMEGVTIVRMGSWLSPNTSGFKRMRGYLSQAFAQMVGSFYTGRADVVIGSSPPLFTGIPGYFASLVKRAPFVFEVRDLWPENMVAIGAMKRGFTLWAMKKLEMFLYRRARRIVPVTEGFLEYIAEKGIPRGKMEVIFNGVDMESFSHDGYPRRLAGELDLQGKFVVAYIGTIGINHGLRVLLDAAEQLKDCPDARLLIVGDGAERKPLEEEALRRGLTNVIFTGERPRGEMPAFHGLADVLFVHLKKADYFHRVIPSKIFVAMSMEKPVLIGVEGEARRIIAAAGAGIGVEPENADEVAEAVRKLYGMRNNGELGKMGRAGRAHVEAHFNRDDLAAQYEVMLEQLVPEDGRD